MIAKIVIDKKREGRALGSAEIREFIAGFTAGEIPDYQMSALAMAICCHGMTERETADLTDSMMRSGACLKWDDLALPTADKHSTGGVGDKLSLVASREKAGDRIDPLAGVTLAVGVGDRVVTGQPLATLERSADPDGLEPCAAQLLAAFAISPTAPEPTPLILDRID